MIKRILFKIFRKLSEEFSSMKNSLMEYEEESKLINNLISAYEAAANRRMRKVQLSTLYGRLGRDEEGRINSVV